MLTGPILKAASRYDWRTVFTFLEINQFQPIIDFQARDLENNKGFRLFDYAERYDSDHPEDKTPMTLKLWKYGIRPSYDIKAFTAAAQGDWENVFKLIELDVIDINLENDMHPLRWTLLNYAMDQGNFNAINHLLINLQAKETTYDPQAQEQSDSMPCFVTPVNQKRSTIDDADFYLAGQEIRNILAQKPPMIPKATLTMTLKLRDGSIKEIPVTEAQKRQIFK